MLNLKPSDKIEILTIIDNSSDIGLKDEKYIRRFSRIDPGGEIWSTTLLAEHGLSLLITVSSGNENHTILMDAGFTATAMEHNLELLDMDLSIVENIVISHGHRDHTGGLPAFLRIMNKPCNVIAHPDALLQRYVETKNGKITYPGHLVRNELNRYNAKIIENSNPMLISNDLVLITGFVPRENTFEKVPQGSFIDRNGTLEKDNISDDQSIILYLENKGLVVISGCAHSGIVNTVNYAVEITGIDRVFAVMGGFHLSGGTPSAVIEETIAGLKKYSPEVIIPVHCTGFRAQCRFAEEFRDPYRINSVGSTVVLVSGSYQ